MEKPAAGSWSIFDRSSNAMMSPSDQFRSAWEVSFGRVPEITHMQVLGGGSINKVYRMISDDGDFVMKLNRSDRFPGMFAAEARGLALLREKLQTGVPEVVLVQDTGSAQCLVIEYLQPQSPLPDRWERFAHRLASLHRCTSTGFGLDHNNWMGSLPQTNAWMNNLSGFFRERRLQPQVDRALSSGMLSAAEAGEFERLYHKLPGLLPFDESAVLIHGDLWAGNVVDGPDGELWMIDPAVAYSCREADLAMTRLFGEFPPEFYEAYDEALPLLPGWEERVSLWNLYPLLVHVNLFGESYLPPVRQTLAYFL